VGCEVLGIFSNLGAFGSVEEDVSFGGCEKTGNCRWWKAGRYEKAGVAKSTKSINVHMVIQVRTAVNPHHCFFFL
jgi:hypothetical protein